MVPRIPLFPVENMTVAQIELYGKIANGPRGQVVGPLRAALHSTPIAERWDALGLVLRYGLSISPRVRELAIIACGRYWNSAVEWWVHADEGYAAGIPQDVIEAIRQGRAPHLPDPLEHAVYEFTRELIQSGQVSDATYEQAYSALGVLGLVELTSLVGYYTMVAMMLNAHHIPLPPVVDASASWRILEGPTERPTPLAAATGAQPAKAEQGA